MIHDLLHAGLVLPESFLHTRFFVILATLVSLNTVIFAALSIIHMFPKWIKPGWSRGRNPRRVTRSIFPDGPK
jgi:hypothetical protein